MDTKQRVDQVRAAIRAQQEHIYIQFNELYKEIKDDLAPESEDWLWSYVFYLDDNTPTEYSKMVEANLFKQ